MPFYIAVIGGSYCSEEEIKLAHAVGAEIARRKSILICGGGSGVMEAASRGAAEAGGTAIGILPGEQREQGNPFLTFTIATGLGEARNAIIVRTADALIAIGGEYGTLSEIALALKMDKPVIGLKSWGLQPPRKLERSIVSAETALESVEITLKILQKS